MKRQLGYFIAGVGSVIRDLGLRLVPDTYPAEQSNAELDAAHGPRR